MEEQSDGFIGSSGRIRTYNPPVNRSARSPSAVYNFSVTQWYRTLEPNTGVHFRVVLARDISRQMILSVTRIRVNFTECGHKNGHTTRPIKTNRNLLQCLKGGLRRAQVEFQGNFCGKLCLTTVGDDERYGRSSEVTAWSAARSRREPPERRRNVCEAQASPILAKELQ